MASLVKGIGRGRGRVDEEHPVADNHSRKEPGGARLEVAFETDFVEEPYATSQSLLWVIRSGALLP